MIEAQSLAVGAICSTFRVLSFVFGAKSLKSRVLRVKRRVLRAEFEVQKAKFRVRRLELWLLRSEF
jgi:hypothetical protein